jgi:limonene 1,2-monooxygenase
MGTTATGRMKFGTFLAPFHPVGENPTLALERDFQLLEHLDTLGYDEAWIGEHHSAGWELIASPEVFIAAAAARTKHIRLGTGVVSLPYHHPLMVADRMVLLDHITRGRVMLGVGPGSLPTDAVMLGIDPVVQRPRMNEALKVIIRLFTETEPITYEAEWFTLKNARLQLRPYTKPHMPIAVAAVQSPAGMVLAGETGSSVLTMSVPRGKDVQALGSFWDIAEETAAKHGNAMDRSEWRIVLHVHLAETREEALRQMSHRGGRYRKEYSEGTTGSAPPSDLGIDEVAANMQKNGDWCIGTPDDLVAKIEELQHWSGGFGGLMVQAVDWADKEHLDHSYELLARYVMPRFQGSLEGIIASREDGARNLNDLRTVRNAALDKARTDYEAAQAEEAARATGG